MIGILGLYADEAHFFEAPETDLFLELAADISLGLEYIDKDQRIAHMLYHDSLYRPAEPPSFAKTACSRRLRVQNPQPLRRRDRGQYHGIPPCGRHLWQPCCRTKP